MISLTVGMLYRYVLHRRFSPLRKDFPLRRRTIFAVGEHNGYVLPLRAARSLVRRDIHAAATAASGISALPYAYSSKKPEGSSTRLVSPGLLCLWARVNVYERAPRQFQYGNFPVFSLLL